MYFVKNRFRNHNRVDSVVGSCNPWKVRDCIGNCAPLAFRRCSSALCRVLRSSKSITRSVPFRNRREVFVGCSRSFRFDRSVKDVHPSVRLHSNDVSLVSCTSGAVATGTELVIAFKGRIAFIENLIAGSDSWRAPLRSRSRWIRRSPRTPSPMPTRTFSAVEGRGHLISGRGLPQWFGRAVAWRCQPAARPCQRVTPTVQRLRTVLGKRRAATTSRLRRKRSGGSGIASLGQHCCRLPPGQKRLGIGKYHWDTIKLCANAPL